MKKLHFLFSITFFLLLTFQLEAQHCASYDCVMNKVKKAIKNKEYRFAFEQLKSAEGYEEKNTDEINNLRDEIFDLIEKDRIRATQQTQIAEKNEQEAIKSKNEAIASKLISNARAVLSAEQDFVTALRLSEASTKVTNPPIIETIEGLHDIVSSTSRNFNASSFLIVRKYAYVNQKLIGYSAFSNDGSLFVSTSTKDNKVRLWDVKNGTNFKTFNLPFRPVSEPVISIDRQKILLYDAQKKVHLIENLSKLKTNVFEDTSRFTPQLFFYNDKPMMVSHGYPDSIINIFNLKERKIFKVLLDSTNPIQYWNTTQSGKYIAGFCAPNLLKVWDIEKGECIFKYSYNSTQFPPPFSFSPSENKLVIGIDRVVELWDYKRNKKIKTFDNDTNNLNSPNNVKTISLSENEKYLLIIQQHNGIRLWNLEWGQPVQSMSISSGANPIAKLSPDNKYIHLLSGGRVIKIPTIEDILDSSKTAILSQEQRKGYGVPDRIKWTTLRQRRRGIAPQGTILKMLSDAEHRGILWNKITKLMHK